MALLRTAAAAAAAAVTKRPGSLAGRCRAILVAIGVVGCASLWPPLWPPPPRPPLDVPTSGYLGAVEISVVGQYFWRDFMPGLYPNRGEDGGSSLYVNVVVSFYNPASWDEYVFIRSARVCHNGQDHPITLGDGGSTAPGYSTVTVEFIARDGPYVPVQSEVLVLMTFANLWGDELTVRTELDEVQATM